MLCHTCGKEKVIELTFQVDNQKKTDPLTYILNINLGPVSVCNIDIINHAWEKNTPVHL